jgi:hypothetical protein
LGDLGINETVLLKWVLKEHAGTMYTRLIRHSITSSRGL